MLGITRANADSPVLEAAEAPRPQGELVPCLAGAVLTLNNGGLSEDLTLTL